MATNGFTVLIRYTAHYASWSAARQGQKSRGGSGECISLFWLSPFGEGIRSDFGLLD
jgi:hypothetical protein